MVIIRHLDLPGEARLWEGLGELVGVRRNQGEQPHQQTNVGESVHDAIMILL